MDEMNNSFDDVVLDAEAPETAQDNADDGMRSIPSPTVLDELYPDNSFKGRMRRAIKNYGYIAYYFRCFH